MGMKVCCSSIGYIAGRVVFDPHPQGATDVDIVPVYVGLDYHSDTIRVCVMNEDGQELFNRSVPSQVGCVVEAIGNCLDRGRRRKRSDADAGVVLVRSVAIEACTGSAEFAARLIEATEWTVKLAHAGAVHRLKQGPDKTDHGDAWHLANLIRVNYLPEVWLADETTRQLRHLVRYRQALSADAKDVKLRIRALLKEDGVPETCEKQAWTKAWRKWIQDVRLPEHSRWIIDQQLALLDHLEQKLADVEQRMQAATHADPVVQKLLEQAGIGLVTAVLLRAIVGRFDRFQSGKQLARYCGLTPCNASSGKRQADSGLVPAGHEDLRAVLIQLAKRLPRHVPRWKEFKERLGRRKPRNVVSAAIANRWLRRLYHELKGVRPAEETAPCAEAA
jgi:transposase